MSDSVYNKQSIILENVEPGTKYIFRFRPVVDDFKYMTDQHGVPIIGKSCGCGVVISHPDKHIQADIVIPPIPHHLVKGSSLSQTITLTPSYMRNNEVKVEHLKIIYTTIPKT